MLEDTISHRLSCLTLEDQTIPSVGEEVNQKSLGILDCYNYFGQQCDNL